ncbi:MAG: type II toxin-antitoxin system HicA family toxin [Dehalococcoidales bacterium]|jgi:predicted RNA binding protein YcfA (HicA-like mRNA interferase family)
MAFPKQVWDQLKNKSVEDIVSALERDGAALDTSRGVARVYRFPDGRLVAIHFHPHKTFGPKLLRDLFEDIGWKEADLKRLKLVK